MTIYPLQKRATSYLPQTFLQILPTYTQPLMFINANKITSLQYKIKMVCNSIFMNIENLMYPQSNFKFNAFLQRKKAYLPNLSSYPHSLLLLLIF